MPSQRSTCVPGGTPTIERRRRRRRGAARPRRARRARRGSARGGGSDCRSRSESSTRTSTSPPRPPSPPSGPPLGTCASRRNDTTPSPPRAGANLDLGAVMEHGRVTVAACRRNPDPVFLITGASTGIGAATARHAAEAGYRVVLAARSHRQARGPRRGARRPRGHLRRHRVGPAAGARRDGARRLRPHRRRVRQRRLRRPARLPRRATRSSGRRWCSPTSTAPR